MLKNFTFMLLF